MLCGIRRLLTSLAMLRAVAGSATARWFYSQRLPGPTVISHGNRATIGTSDHGVPCPARGDGMLVAGWRFSQV
jgi:hypothetical protein